MLPEYIDQLEVRRLRVGSAAADLRFKRTSNEIVVDVLKIDGQLDVVVETDQWGSAAETIF